MTTKHTKGPWHVASDGDAVCDERGNRICQFFDRFEDDFDNQRANATLIASAPAMAEELDRLRELNKELVEAMGGLVEKVCDIRGVDIEGVYAEEEVKNARAAIAKAKGE